MMNDYKDYVQLYPQLMLYPGLFIAITVMGFSLFGSGLKSLLKRRRQHMNYTSTVLQAKNISVQFTTEKGCVQAVKDISIEVHKGKITALIGQSGSGKSATAMAIAGILDSNGTMTSGQIYLQNQDINKLKGKSLRTYRGKHLGMIFQEPMESLNPLLKIGEQIYQTLRLTQKLNKKTSKTKIHCITEASRSA